MAFLGVHIAASCSTRMPGSPSSGAFIPGLSEYRSSAVALGTMALYAFLITAVTARYTKLLPPGVWLKIHRLSLVVFVLAWLHAVLAGTDSGALAALYVGDRPGRRRARVLSLLGVAPATSHVHHIARGGRPTMSVTSTPAPSHPDRRPRGRRPPARVRRHPRGIRLDRRGGTARRQPAAAASIEAKLAAEQARSADLQDRLDDDTGQTDEMTTALPGRPGPDRDRRRPRRPAGRRSGRGQGEPQEARGIDQEGGRAPSGP